MPTLEDIYADMLYILSQCALIEQLLQAIKPEMEVTPEASQSND